MRARRLPGLGKPFDPPRAAERRAQPEDPLARALGWFSVGLGVLQVITPDLVNRIIGVRDNWRTRLVQRMVGARELAAAGGIFSRRQPVPWLWARVAGDAMDLALLGLALRRSESRTRTMLAIGSVAGVAGADGFAAVRSSRATERDPRIVKATITVNSAREDVYRFWHDLQNLPRFMAHLESVQVMDGRSHWKAAGPAGRTVEWDAETVEDRPNEVIAWRSLPGTRVANAGTVRFAPAPGDRGTEVTVELRYDPPGGALGATAAKLFGEEPLRQVNDDLRRFKQLVETGIIVRSEGSPEGILNRRLIRQRPAQPVESS